jgi:hypothetical protein
MKLAFISNSVVLTVLAATSASAETYQGVQTIQSSRTRAEVIAEAKNAARDPVFGEAAYVVAAPVTKSSRTLMQARADVIAARIGNPYAEAESAGVLSVGKGVATRAAVRAEGREAAKYPAAF